MRVVSPFLYCKLSQCCSHISYAHANLESSLLQKESVLVTQLQQIIWQAKGHSRKTTVSITSNYMSTASMFVSHWWCASFWLLYWTQRVPWDIRHKWHHMVWKNLPTSCWIWSASLAKDSVFFSIFDLLSSWNHQILLVSLRSQKYLYHTVQLRRNPFPLFRKVFQLAEVYWHEHVLEWILTQEVVAVYIGFLTVVSVQKYR